MRLLRHSLPLLLVLLVGVGCVRLPREPLEVQRYSIDLPDSTWSADTTLALTVFVPPFQASAQQRGDRIFYRDSESGMNFYFYHRWVVSPERMIGDVFARSLMQSGLFGGGVFQGETGVIPTHEIQGRLNTLYADNERGQYKAVLNLKLTVFRIDPVTYQKSVLFQKSYPLEVERRNGYVESYIPAVNEAVVTWLDDTRKDLVPLFEEEAAVWKGRGLNQHRGPTVPSLSPLMPLATPAPALPETEAIPDTLAPGEPLQSVAPDSTAAVAPPATRPVLPGIAPLSADTTAAPASPDTLKAAPADTTAADAGQG